MKPVVCFGEALIDFLMLKTTHQERLNLPEFRQYPGGAPANAAVAIAKLGGQAQFAGQVGDDSFGHFLAKALVDYGVNTDFLEHHPQAKTALAFVMLDALGERSFSFHRDGSADVIFTKQQVQDEWFIDDAIFHFCSNTLTTDTIAETTQYAVHQAHKHNALISFDVNLRHNLWSNGKADIQVVNQLVFQSNLLKFAREEFDYLAQGKPQDFIEQCFSQHCQAIIITDGDQTMDYHTPHFKGQLIPPKVNTIDSTAGGDAFIGGLLRILSCLDDSQSAFTSPQTLEPILQFASYCGACAVTEKGAFPALPTLDRVSSLYVNNNIDFSQIQSLITT